MATRVGRATFDANRFRNRIAEIQHQQQLTLANPVAPSRAAVEGYTDEYLQSRDVSNDMLFDTVNASLTPRQDVELMEIPDNILLEEAADLALEFASGQIPDDVRQAIEQMSAETTLQGGLGASQAAINVTARDLGTTSMALSRYGLESLTALGALQQEEALELARIDSENQRANEANKIKYAELRQVMSEAEDRFYKDINTYVLNERALELQAIELAQVPQLAVMEISAELIRSNSIDEIPGFQDNINQFQGNADALSSVPLRFLS